MSDEKLLSGAFGKLVLVTVLGIALAVAAAWYFVASQRGAAGQSRVLEFSDADFGQRIKDGVVLVDFWATWCGPCHAQAPIVEKVAAAFAGRAAVAKVDVDVSPEIARRMAIDSIPTLIVFKNGKIVDRFVGVHDEGDLTKALDNALR